MKFIVAALALLLLPGLARAQTPAAAQNPRIALIIGNAAYPDHPLATTANDAGLVAQTLQAAGFEVVGARDLDQDTLRGALRDFLTKAATIGPDMQAFVYLSGRGVQYDGDNYFMPVDAQVARDADIPIQAIKISDFSRALAATPGRARIIVLDAARASAFAADGSALAGGLGLVDPEDGALMAFNAAPGTLAPDEPGPYGVFGKSLAGAMRAGGLPIDDVFAQVRLQVNQQTNGAVVPWSISKIKEPYSIFEAAPDAPPPPALAAAADIAKRPFSSLGPDEAYSVALQGDTLNGYQQYLAAYPDSPQARRVRAILAARREAIFWRRSVNDNSARAYWTYLRVYPKGPHVPDARRRLEILSAQFTPPPDFAPLEYADAPPPPPDELAYDTGPAFVFDGPDYGPPPPPPPYAFLPEEDDGWRNLPPPPPAGLGYLPVLPVAIPLLIGAKVFRDRRAGHERPAVGAPPPLPHGFRPQAAPGAQPAPGAGRPLPGAPGVVAPGRPSNNLNPLPGAPASANPGRPVGSGRPLPTPAEPLVVRPGGQPGGTVRPLPTRAEPLVVKPGGQPGPGLKPLPTPGEPLVVKPGERPAGESRPTRPGFNGAPRQDLKAGPTGSGPAPRVERPMQRMAPPPVQRMAPQPVQHMAPPQAPHMAPAPAQHMAPPPVQHMAPPPVQHMAPPPVQHMAPPVQRAAPPAGRRPACGEPHAPPCPK
jgi:uncharacterized caspase-like protein